MTTVSEVAAVASAPRGCSATDVAAAARAMEAAGRPVLHLEVGEPDFPTPPHVVAAAVAALQAGRTRYAPAAGLPELREAAAEALARRGVHVAVSDRSPRTRATSAAGTEA